MKADIHPEYRYVVFRDVSSSFEFLTRSCASAREETEYEGETYPLIPIDISSESHPFYTGTQKLLDTEGRVERFYRKYGFAKTPEASGEVDEPVEATEGETAES